MDEFSKKELAGILDTIEAAYNSSSPEEFKRAIMMAKDLVSADHAICGIGRVSLGAPSDIVAIVNGNYPDKWLSHYYAHKFYLADPIVRFHTQFSMTQFWSDVFRRYENSDRSREVIAHAGEFGLRHGISSGIYTPGYETVGIFSFASGFDRFHPHHKKIIDILIAHLNKALYRVVGEEQCPAAPTAQMAKI